MGYDPLGLELNEHHLSYAVKAPPAKQEKIDQLKAICKVIRARANQLSAKGHTETTHTATRMVAIWLESPEGKQAIADLMK